MGAVAVAGAAVLVAAVAAMLRRYHQEYAMAVTLAAGIFLLLQILRAISPVAVRIQALLSVSGLDSQAGGTLLKSLGICFLAQFSADACRDAGEGAMASKVELAGKAAVAVLALPLLESVAETALRLIGGST